MGSTSSSPADHEESPVQVRAGRTLFARNRRDGARLLSSALIITVIALVNWGHPVGRSIAVAGSVVSLYWWLRYRQLNP